MRSLLRKLRVPSQKAAPPISASRDRAVHDLRDHDELTFTLLDDTHRWRERLVEEFVIEDGDHIAVTSAYQIRIPADLFRRFGDNIETGDRVRLLLPLTTRPKDLLLGVDLVGPDGPCSLLLKSQIATMQLDYITWLSGQEVDADIEELLVAVFTFNGGTWGHFKQEYRKLDCSEQLARYLSEGLGIAVSSQNVEALAQRFEAARLLLLDALEEPAEPDSALDNVLLALPFARRAPKSVSEIGTWLTKFDRFIRAADHESRAVLAEYGRRWELIIDVVLPVGEPCKVKLATRRPWDSAHPDSTTQRIAIGDAATAHVDVRIADHSVKIKKQPELRTLHGDQIGIPVVDDLRFTDDTATIYVSNDERRPYYLDLKVHLALRPSVRHTTSVLWLLIAVAIVLSLLIPENDQMADGLALLVFPLTLAGTLVHTRSTTGAAQRLQERSRSRLLFFIALMWLVAASRLIIQGIDVGWLGVSWDEVVSTLMFW